MFLEVKRRPPSTGGDHTVENAYQSVVDPILEDLRIQGHKFDKTIVYMPLKWCGLMHHRAMTDFIHDHPDDKVQQSVDAQQLTCLVSQYHAPQSNRVSFLLIGIRNEL